MEMHKTINISLNETREWYKSDSETLIRPALKAFSKDELTYNFKNITTFKKACEALSLDYDDMFYITKNIATISNASAAMFKLNIIRKALNLGQDLHLTKNPEDSYIYYPYNPFVTKSYTYYNSDINSGKMEIIGKIKSEGTLYDVLGGDADGGGVGFLGCANKEIAKHFGKYFGMLITEAKYGDLDGFEIIEDKYGNA